MVLGPILTRTEFDMIGRVSGRGCARLSLFVPVARWLPCEDANGWIGIVHDSFLSPSLRNVAGLAGLELSRAFNLCLGQAMF